MSHSNISPVFHLHPKLDIELTTLYEQLRSSVVQVSGGNGNAAGTIWRSDGLIVTNAHVAGHHDSLRIELHGGRTYEGRVIARDTFDDLALVEIDTTGLPAVTVGDSSRIRPGQLAISIGHPHGAINNLTFGIVVAAGQITTKHGPRSRDLVQTDARIAPGSSGGPLIDATGSVIGINTRVNGQLSLAVPSERVTHFIAGLIPSIAPVFLGIDGTIAILPHGPQPSGLVVTEIVPNSPAERAGLIVGDVVLIIGTTTIIDRESIAVATFPLRPGEPVELRFIRGGVLHALTIEPEKQQQVLRGRAY